MILGYVIDTLFLVGACIYSYQGHVEQANHLLLFLIASNVSTLCNALRGGVDLHVKH